ncbi:MAG: primosomal replication protein N [Chloroflexota bacterium]
MTNAHPPLPQQAEGKAPSPARRGATERPGVRAGAALFPGFPPGARATLVPNPFFAELLPQVDDPAELLVTLYLFFALGRRRGFPRAVTFDELAAETPLRRALARLAGGAEEGLRRGLERAVARGAVLCARRDGLELYLINTAAARAAIAAGRMPGVELVPAPAPLPDEPPPSIYTLFEENIGTISPLIADELREVEASYPAAWIVAAFKEAVSLNKRNWRYIVRILERWHAEGRSDATVGRDLQRTPRRRDLEGRYRNLVRR